MSAAAGMFYILSNLRNNRYSSSYRRSHCSHEYSYDYKAQPERSICTKCGHVLEKKEKK